eukprot:c2697_g1_i1 orf=262-516(+)
MGLRKLIPPWQPMTRWIGLPLAHSLLLEAQKQNIHKNSSQAYFVAVLHSKPKKRNIINVLHSSVPESSYAILSHTHGSINFCLL